MRYARRLAALRGATALVLAAVWSVVPASQALAYVDPSVMTYTIQAVAGLAVALSAVIGVVFRRTRRKLYQLFRIDENAHKAVEPEVGRIQPDAPDSAQQLERARESAQRLADACNEGITTHTRKMRWRSRFAFAAVTCVFMAFIVFIAPALEIFGSNGDSLVFGLGSVWWIPVVFCLAIALVAAALIASLKGRAFYIVLAVVFALTVAAYVQSLFLNHGMMPADGGFIGWNEPYFTSKMTLSFAVWTIIIVGLVAASIWRPHLSLKAATGVACAIMVVQLVGVGSVALDASKNPVAERGKPYVTQGDLLTVSPKSNVVVFVLDTYDTDLLEQILREDPRFLSSFEDFTYFPNSTGTMIPTANAIPNLLTGLKPAPGQDLGEYRATKYEKSPFIRDIRKRGYTVGVYSDSLMMDFGNPADRATADETLNVHPVSHAPIDVVRTFLAMEQCALYREAPWNLKPLFWYYTSDVNNRMIADSGASNMNDSLYELDDAAILRMVRDEGIRPTDERGAGAFRFIHLFGPHFPFSVNENGEDVGTNQSDQLSQAKGSMRVVDEYLADLKELGLYDEATIVVTADHGVWNLTEDPVQNAISPIMLVKPRHGERGHHGRRDGTREPVRRSSQPVSHDDFQATVIDAVGADASPYGKTFFQVDDPNRVRCFDALTNVGGNGQRFVEYAIAGDALDLRNWSKTGNEWMGA